MKTPLRVQRWTCTVMDMNEERITTLTKQAKTLSTQRNTITTSLKGIAANLWREGLHNVLDISRRTGLSRMTVYAALRERGIEPTNREK
uniref:Uncharacterized protein n=1 Tax=Streptomyces somaliensis TaxID=78355 RepID=A0A140GIG0_9ACTN|nr:hypothetical protein [Streptomyces somaliensis]